MKNLFFAVALLITCGLVAFATPCYAQKQAKKKADKATLVWEYEIEPTTGQAVQGSILVKVWSYSKKKEVALEQAGKNAVHGVLFKGVAGLKDGHNRVPEQKPMVTDVTAEETHAKFLKEFFSDGGKYMKYVNFVNNGVPGPGDIIKVGKEYKVGVRVSVSKDALRKEMEAAGIVKALGAGFN
jgi:hypothetical protein